MRLFLGLYFHNHTEIDEFIECELEGTLGALYITKDEDIDSQRDEKTCSEFPS